MNKILGFLGFLGLFSLAQAGDNVTIEYGGKKAQVTTDGALKTTAVINAGSLTVNSGTETILRDTEGDQADISLYKELRTVERDTTSVEKSLSVLGGGFGTQTYTNTGSKKFWIGYAIYSFEDTDISNTGGKATFKLEDVTNSNIFYGITTAPMPCYSLHFGGGGIPISNGSSINLTAYNPENVNQNFKIVLIFRITQ